MGFGLGENVFSLCFWVGALSFYVCTDARALVCWCWFFALLLFISVFLLVVLLRWIIVSMVASGLFVLMRCSDVDFQL